MEVRWFVAALLAAGASASLARGQGESPVAPPAAPPVAPPAAPPKLGPDDKLCGLCQTSGRVAFEVPKEVVAQEAGCTRCSEIVANEAVNHGLDFKPCAKCLAPTLQAHVRGEWQALVKAGLDWLAEQRQIDAFLADPKGLHLMHCSTPHFELAWSVPKVKLGRQVIDQHEAMHLYARYLEEDYGAYLATLGLTHDGDQGGVRHHVMVFEQAKHANKAQPHWCGMGGTGITDGVKLMGPKSYFVCWWNRTKNPDNDQFHEYLLHNLVHHFLCSEGNMFWLARKSGWIDEGLSHYFTDLRFKKCRTHCFQEQDEASQWILSDWRPEMRRRAVAGKYPEFAEVSTKHGETLDAEEHLFCWSLVEYLIDGQGKEKFVALLHGLKDEVPLRNLLKELYGVSLFQLIEAWKAWVIEKYPPR
jgi:hypothetical protein